MSLEVNVWSDVSVNVETPASRGAGVALTSISKASPGVVGKVAHGYLDGELLLLLVSGMVELDYMIVRVANKTADTFELEGVDTTDFHTFISGTAYKLTFGAAASTFTDVNASGGEAEDIQIRTIHNSRDFNVPGNFGASSYSFGSLWDVNDPALVALKAFSKAKGVCGVEIEFATGAKVYFAGVPSVSMAPTGSAGGAVTTPVKMNVRGDFTTYAS